MQNEASTITTNTEKKHTISYNRMILHLYLGHNK